MSSSAYLEPAYDPSVSVAITAAPSFISPFSSSPSSSPTTHHRSLHYGHDDSISPRTASDPNARFPDLSYPLPLDFAKLTLPASSHGNTSTSDLEDARSPPSLLTSFLLQSRSGSGSKLGDSAAVGGDADGLPTPTLLSNGASRQSSASSQSQPCTPPSAGTTIPLAPAVGNNKPILLRPRTSHRGPGYNGASASTSTTPYTSASEDGRPFGVGLGLSSLSEAVESAGRDSREPLGTDGAQDRARLVKRKSCLKFAVQHISPLSSPGAIIPPPHVLPNPARRASVQIDERYHRPTSPPIRQRGMVMNGRSCYPSPPPVHTYVEEVDDEIEHIEQASDEGYEEDSESGFSEDEDGDGDIDEAEDEEDEHSERHALGASFDSYQAQSYQSHFEDEYGSVHHISLSNGAEEVPDFLFPSRPTRGLAPAPNPYAYRWPLPSPHRPPTTPRRPSESGIDSYFPPIPHPVASNSVSIPQARRVSLPQNIACPPRCSRHSSPPPQAPLSSPLETAPPAACSPSAAEFVRRRSSRGTADDVDDDLPAVLQVGDGRRPSRQWDAIDTMDGLGALALYAYNRKGSAPESQINAARRGILKRTITSYDSVPRSFGPSSTYRSRGRGRTGQPTASGSGTASGPASGVASPQSGRSGSSTPMMPPRVMRRGTAPAALPKLGMTALVIDVEGQMERGKDGEARKELERALKGR